MPIYKQISNHFKFTRFSFFPLHRSGEQLQSFRASDPHVDIDNIEEITYMFIEAGIHMDAVNVEGLTAAQICASRKYIYQSVDMTIGTFFSISLLSRSHPSAAFSPMINSHTMNFTFFLYPFFRFSMRFLRLRP